MVVLKVETCDGVSGARKRFLGVDKQGKKWRARARNPLLRVDVHLGYYKTPEEAELVAKKKRAEFKEMFKDLDSSSMGNGRGYFEGKKLPTGVRWNKGRYLARVWHPKLKKEVLCCSSKIFEEAANAADKKRAEFRETYGAKLRVIPDNEVLKEFDSEGARNQKKAELDAKLKMPEFDWVEVRSRSEANESPMKLKCQLGYDCPTSLLCARNLNKDALVDKLNCDCGLVDIPVNVVDWLGHGSPTSVFDPKNMNIASVGDRTFDSEFDRAVSLGIINEYGQLLGKFSEIETQIWLNSTDNM